MEWTECRHWFLLSARPLREKRTKISKSLPSAPRLHPRGFGDLPLGPGASQDAAWAGPGAAPDPELRAQHHGQLPAPRAPAGPWEAEGQLPPFAAGGAGRPRQEAGPQGFSRRRAIGPGRGGAGQRASRPRRRPRAVVGEAARGAGWGLLWQGRRPDRARSRFVRVYSGICFRASLPPRRAVVLHPSGPASWAPQTDSRPVVSPRPRPYSPAAVRTPESAQVWVPLPPTARSAGARLSKPLGRAESRALPRIRSGFGRRSSPISRCGAESPSAFLTVCLSWARLYY